MRISITPSLSIDDAYIEERFVRSSGPGGQNVNKLATAVQLRFDPAGLPDDVRARLFEKVGSRRTEDGVILVEASRFRTQSRNRADALERLVELVRRAAEPPKPRRATRPTKASKVRRLESKQRRAETKRRRRPASEE